MEVYETNAEKSLPEVPGAPALTTEVKIRTLASDLASLSQGGGVPAFSETVSLPKPRRAASAGAPIPRIEPASPASHVFFWFVFILILLGALGFLSYYFLPSILGEADVPGARLEFNSDSFTAAAAAAESSGPPPLFRRAQASLKLPLDTFNSEITYRDRLQKSLRSVTADKFVELIIMADVKRAEWNNFLANLEAPLLTNDFFSGHFEPEMYAFVYRDRRGTWPGYVLKLKPQETPILLQLDLIKIETQTSSLVKLFYASPGKMVSEFSDDQLSSEPIRSAVFTKGSFYYGWFYDQYLILSTSFEGLKQALQRF